MSAVEGALLRARGCLLGQLAGDSLGSLVEFQSADAIRRRYPEGVRDLADGGTWDTLAGQPTDDSEMALALARSLVARGDYEVEAARAAYVDWLQSGPFDCGATVAAGLRGQPNGGSQANGALMRVSPLGIFGAFHEGDQVARWARLDAQITHPHSVCLEANALFARAVAHTIRTGEGPRAVYAAVDTWSRDLGDEHPLRASLLQAAQSPPRYDLHQQGWVLIAFQNAFWQLLHAPSLEAGVVDTVGRGGDTDTNAAICGALLGAVYGLAAVPPRWVDAVLSCRPRHGDPGVRRPRPGRFWPVDALELAERLLEGRREPADGSRAADPRCREDEPS